MQSNISKLEIVEKDSQAYIDGYRYKLVRGEEILYFVSYEDLEKELKK